jgi:hypothetical protein
VLNQARRPQFADEQKTKADYVKMIQSSLQELQSQKPKDAMAALVEQHSGKGSMYDDDELFSRLESRCVLFPCFEINFTHSKANAALKLMLKHAKRMAEGKPFDCSAVKTAETRAQELQKALDEKDAQIEQMRNEMEELTERKQQLDTQEEEVKQLIEDAKAKGADTSALEEKRKGIKDEKKGLLDQMEKYQAEAEKQNGGLGDMLDTMESVIGVFR